MKRTLSIAIFSVLCMAIQAQSIRLKVNVFDSDGTPSPQARVWSFVSAASAQKATDLYNTANFELTRSGRAFSEDDFKNYTLTDKANYSGSTVEMNAYLDGALVIEAGFDNRLVCVRIKGSSGFVKNESGYFYSYTVPSVIDAKTGYANVRHNKTGDWSAELQAAEKVASLTALTTRKGIGNMCGGTIDWSRQINLSRDYTRSDARVVVLPYLVDIVTGDTILAFNPTVVDGEDYHRTMHRKMGYQKLLTDSTQVDAEAHDRLNRYICYLPENISRSGFMRKHMEIPLTVSGHVSDNSRLSEGGQYKVLGHITYEDYNTIYHEENCELWDGNRIDPKRYLNYSIPSMDIDSTHYRRDLLTTEVEGGKSYSLEWVVGKAELQQDSTTQMLLHDMTYDLQDLRRQVSKGNGSIKDIRVHVYTSPEGGEANNLRLSEERTQYVISLLSRNISERFTPRPHIIQWEEVADTMEMMEGFDETTMHRYAQEIRDICRSYKDMDSRWREIKRHPWYAFVLDSIIGPMRRVEIRYVTISNRIEPGDITYSQFKSGNPRYTECRNFFTYQYYNLMNRLYRDRDWKSLERVARLCISNHDSYANPWETVTRSVKEYAKDKDGRYILDSLGHKRIIVTKQRKAERRPYPLAAYYLMKCLEARGATDFSLVYADTAARQKKYIYMDASFNPIKENGVYRRENDYALRGKWWNDEAIVMQTVNMFLRAKKFSKASSIAYNYLPIDDPSYRAYILYLRAMNCEYDDPQVVQVLSAIDPMNAVALYLMQDDPRYIAKADSLIGIDSLFDQNDCRVPYLKAVCRYMKECPSRNLDFVLHYPSENIYNEDNRDGRQKGLGDWARPMLRALDASPDNVECLKHDGFFNDAYRHLVFYIWKRLKDGLTLEEAAQEYDNMWNEYQQEYKK